MPEFDFPHKSTQAQFNNFRTNPPSKFNQFNENVKEIRIMLNKLSKKNFKMISEKILTRFQFTPSLLKELSVRSFDNY
jgi:hypothetical protein